MIKIAFKLRGRQWEIRYVTENAVRQDMENLKKSYPDNNEISTKMLNWLEKKTEYKEISINFEENENRPEYPKILLIGKYGREVVFVKYAHKLIWAKLKMYCGIC